MIKTETRSFHNWIPYQVNLGQMFQKKPQFLRTGVEMT